MRVGDFAEPKPEHFKEVPEDVVRFSSPTHQQLQKLTKAVQSRLSLENRNAEEWEGELKHDTAAQIILQTLRGFARSVVIAYTAGTYARLDWEPVDESTINVKVKWDTDPGTPTNVRLWIEGA